LNVKCRFQMATGLFLHPTKVLGWDGFSISWASTNLFRSCWGERAVDRMMIKPSVGTRCWAVTFST
jgi:hypothetical protein